LQHRYYIPANSPNDNKKIRDVYEMALLVWRHHCWSSVGSRVLEAALSMIDRDRDGENADRAQLAALVQMYISIGLDEDNAVMFYRREFRDPYIARTKMYYVKESDAFLQQNSVSEYMKRAEQRLALEQTAAHQFLHPTTEPELMKACEEVLIERHNEVLQNEFQSMLQDDREADMKRFFGLLGRLTEGLNLSSHTMKDYLKLRGETIVAEQATKLKTKQAVKNSVVLIDALLELHRKYAVIVAKCFSDHKLFVQAMDEAFTVFINKEVGAFSMAELLNFYVDNLLKGQQKLNEQQLDETLEAIVRLFSYFDDKDMFYAAFRRSLSKRLLGRKFKEADEMNFIQKLKIRCGDAYTKKLEGMFNDIKVSEDKAPEFQEYLKEKGGPKLPADLSVLVLNDVYWPIQKGGPELVVPAEFVPCVNSFEEYYKSTTEKRKLTWLYNQGTVSVLHTFLDEKKRAKRIEVIVSPIQAAILLLFNDDKARSFKDVQTELNLTEESLKFSIAPLIYAKFPLIKRKPEAADDDEEPAADAAKEDADGDSDAPKAKPKAKPKPRAKPKKGDDDDEDGDDDGDDEEEDAAAGGDGEAAKKRRLLAAKRKADKEDEVVLESDTFILAKETKPPRNRIPYPPGSANMMKKEHKEIKDKTQEERIMKIELALVRVMKSRNVCTLSELIAEASSQLMPFFRPDPKMMKKRIEALMERGFMRRDDADQRRIHYVA
jgi:cullin 1